MSAAAMMARQAPRPVMRQRPAQPMPELRYLAVLATNACPACHGTGARIKTVCNCVHRRVFRACLRKYRDCEARPSRLRLEFAADFWLVAKRSLDEFHWRVFTLHFIEGRQWRDCASRLRVDRGTFFHAVYRIERQLGQVYRELKPYALFPTDVYFGNPGRLVDNCPPEFPGWVELAA